MATYCTKDELERYGINRKAIERVPPGDKDAAIDAASDVVDSYLRARYTLPLTTFGSDIKRACAVLAVYDLIHVRGYDTAARDDETLQTRYDQTIAWLKDISMRRAHPDVTDSTPEPEPGSAVRSGTPRVESNSQRGWFRRDGKGGAFSGGR